MENALNLVRLPIEPTSVRESAHAARLAYEEAVNSDGVSATSWQAIAEDMHATADLLEQIGALRGVVQCQRDRAVDAGHRASYATRMVEVARNSRVIDLGTLVSEVRS